MPRIYKKNLEARRYMNYSKEKLEQAIDMCISRKISIRKAAEEFQVPRSTLVYHMKLKKKQSAHVPKSLGGQTALTPAEEDAIVEHILGLATYDFPISLRDLKEIVHTYLTKLDKNVRQFKNNTPGNDWVNGFLKRHEGILAIIAKNNSTNTESVNQEVAVDSLKNEEEEYELIIPDIICDCKRANLLGEPGAENIKCSTEECTMLNSMSKRLEK